MTVRRKTESKVPHVFVHKIADVRGGISIATSVLGGDYIKQGAVVSAPTNGICNIVKVGVLYAAATATDTTYKVKKHSNFAVGDYITAATGGTAYAITAIDYTNSAYDVITIGTTLGVVIDEGGTIVEAAAEADGSDSTSALKYTPFALVGTGGSFSTTSNFATDGILIGVTTGNILPDEVYNALKGIINY